MVYTVTLNPSLDYYLWLPEHAAPGTVIRAGKERVYPGGKGINVSLMLQRMGAASVALGFLAGFTGKETASLLDRAGCRTDFIWLDQGNTRMNIKLETGIETEINGNGPEIPTQALDTLMGKLNRLQPGDFLVLAGSIPSSLPSDTYEQILEKCAGKGIFFVVDAAGELLKKSLAYHPFLIKPNQAELEEIFGGGLDYLDCAASLQRMGAENVLISLAGEGAVLLTKDGKLLQRGCPQGKAISSVGAGDSMVAGFLAGYLRTGSLEGALELGIAAGSATAFSPWLAEKTAIASLVGQPERFGLS